MNEEKHPLTFLNKVYLMVLLFVSILFHYFGERHFILIAFRFTPAIVLLLPALLLLTLSLTLKRKIDAAMATVTCLLVLFNFFDLRLRGRQEPIALGQKLQIVSWNIHHSYKGAQKTAQDLQKLNADIILLQECSPVPKNKWPDPLPYIKAALPKYHCVRSRSLAIVSRYPLTKLGEEKISIHRPALLAKAKIGKQEVTIMNVHLYVNTPGKPQLRQQWYKPWNFLNDLINVRQDAADILSDLLGEIKGPLIVGGDLNTTPNSLICQKLESKLQDCFKSAGFGFGLTYSAKFPLWRIDHLYVSDHLEPLHCQVKDLTSSDHKPLLAQILLK